MTDQPWTVYVLMCVNGRTYIGMALDVEARFRQHVAGRGSVFTRINRPYCVMAARKFSSRTLAGREERSLKRASQHWVRYWCRTNLYYGPSSQTDLPPQVPPAPTAAT
jgi:putative endonuclease